MTIPIYPICFINKKKSKQIQLYLTPQCNFCKTAT